MKKNLLISILLLAVFTAFAQKLPFQGKLIENGVAVDSTLSFEFSIPSLEWSETHGDVVITDGLYFVVLGSINPLPDSLFYGTDEQSLDISVDGTALSPVVLFKPLATPYEGSELNVRNSEGTVVGSMKARTDSVKHGELKIMGENTGIFEAGFYKANDDLETDIPFISLEKDSTTLSYMSALKWNDNLNGRIYLGSTGGDYANIYPNQFNGRHNGRSLFHIGHADWSNTGNFGLLLLDGPNSGNFELTGQHWGNPDLPFLKMKGSENQSTLTLSVENNPDESGTISLNTKRDENLIYRELNINSTGLQIREKENWNVLHEAVSINAENRDDLGWAGYLNLSGPNWGNVYMGTQGNPDLPLMTLQGTDNHEAVEIGCYDSPWQEGYIVVRANNDDYMRFDATGISGSLPIEISNGANVTNDLNVNGVQ